MYKLTKHYIVQTVRAIDKPQPIMLNLLCTYYIWFWAMLKILPIMLNIMPMTTAIMPQFIYNLIVLMTRFA